jgi:hypothetical protein
MNFQDLEKSLKQQFESINKKMIDQEKVKHDAFLEKHFDKYDVLSEKQSSFRSQLITLEGVILAAVIVFTNNESVTIWLILSVCLILISIFFGIWSQDMSIQASYQTHEDDYSQELKRHWWLRELWGDSSVKTEKEFIGKHLEEREGAYKKKFEYKILKVLHLNADRVELIFKLTFIFALFFLILHISTNFMLNDKVERQKYPTINRHFYR